MNEYSRFECIFEPAVEYHFSASANVRMCECRRIVYMISEEINELFVSKLHRCSHLIVIIETKYCIGFHKYS